MQNRDAALLFRHFCRGDNIVNIHQRMGVNAGIVMHALGAIFAIFGAPAGFDRQQRRDLNFVRIMKLANGSSAP